MLAKLRDYYEHMRSLLTRKKVGLTTTEATVSVSKYNKTIKENAIQRGRYRLKTSQELHFSLIDITQDKSSGQVLYSILCVETEDKFKLSRKLFGLLFERDTTSKSTNIFKPKLSTGQNHEAI